MSKTMEKHKFICQFKSVFILVNVLFPKFVLAKYHPMGGLNNISLFYDVAVVRNQVWAEYTTFCSKTISFNL